MNRALGTVLVTLIFHAAAASAQAPDQINGYKNCSTRNLAACDNSNELFFGQFNKSGPSPKKPDFFKALNQFLQGSPKIFVAGNAFAPAQIAQESLMGPGHHHDHLSNGNWFFDGFTPHNAPEIGATIFDPTGKILLVATLSAASDDRASIFDGNEMTLRIYSRSMDTKPESIRVMQNWARSSVENSNNRNAGFNFPGSKEKIARAELLSATSANHWQARILP